MTISLNIYKLFRENKLLIVKNYLLRDNIDDEIVGKNLYETLELSNDILTKINKLMKNEKIVIDIYQKILIAFNKFFSKNYNIDILLCYTNKSSDSYIFLEFEEIYQYISDDSINNTNTKIGPTVFKNVLNNISNERIAYNRFTLNKNVVDIKNKYAFQVSQEEFNISTDGWTIVNYDDVFFYIIQNGKFADLRIDSTNSRSEYDNFINFVNDAYSPIKDSFLDNKNIPGLNNFSNSQLSKRKSLINLDKLDNLHEIPDQLSGYSENYNDIQDSDDFDDDFEKSKEFYDSFFENIKFFTYQYSKIKYPPASANNVREPMIKDFIIHQYKTLKSVTPEYQTLWKNMRTSLLTTLKDLSKRYPLVPEKRYFLFDTEGGGAKHFDYALYAFTESDLLKDQNEMISTKNIWKKLEFKSSEKTAKNIQTLPGYLTKSVANLFPTVQSSFEKTFKRIIQNTKKSEDERIIDLNEFLLKNKDYVQTAIENQLKTQRKVFIIWNSDNKRFYIDEFSDNQLIIKDISFIVNYQHIKIIVETDDEDSKHTITSSRNNDTFSFNFKLSIVKYKFTVSGKIKSEDNSDRLIDDTDNYDFEISKKIFHDKEFTVTISGTLKDITQWTKNNTQNIIGDFNIFNQFIVSGRIKSVNNSGRLIHDTKNYGFEIIKKIFDSEEFTVTILGTQKDINELTKNNTENIKGEFIIKKVT